MEIEVHMRKKSGREFQIEGAEKEKALLPKVDLTFGTTSRCCSVDLRFLEGL